MATKTKTKSGMLQNVGKSMGSFFWKTEESGDTPPDQETSDKGSSESSVTSPSTEVSTPEFILGSGKEDPTIKATLMGALGRVVSKGNYDYLKFAQSISDQAKFIPAEEIRFQATFAVAKSMGISQEDLIADAQQYLDVLKEEESKFQTSIAGITQQNVSSKQTQLDAIDKQTEEKAKQIEALTNEINELQKQKAPITNDISQSKLKIEQMKANFSTTLKTVVDRITGDITKIKKYIPA